LENILTAFFQPNGGPQHSKWYQQFFPYMFSRKDDEK
jgi:hypothetical protein